MPAPGAVLAGVLDGRPKLVRRHGLAKAVADVGGHDPVPAGGAPERRLVRPPAAAPDRDPRLLHRARPHRHIHGGQVLAADRHRFPAPQRIQQVQGLIQPRSPLPGITGLAEGGELSRQRPQPGPHDQPSPRQLVQSHRLPRHLAHPAAGQHVHQDADPDPGRARRDRGDHCHRIRDVPARIAPQQMVPDKEAIPAMLLSCHRQLHQQQRVTERAHVRHPHRAAQLSGHSVTLARRSCVPDQR